MRDGLLFEGVPDSSFQQSLPETPFVMPSEPVQSQTLISRPPSMLSDPVPKSLLLSGCAPHQASRGALTRSAGSPSPASGTQEAPLSAHADQLPS